MCESEILRIFENSDEYIFKTYSVAELKEMYKCIYESERKSKATKADIIGSIRVYVLAIQRARDFEYDTK